MPRWFLISGILVCTFFSAYFFDRAFTPNPTSRLLPVVTFVEDGSWRIDRLKDWSQDHAKIGGHFYTDKAPFSSWVVIPFFAADRALLHPPPPYRDLWAAFSAGIWVCGIAPFMLLIAALFYELGIRRRSTDAVWLSLLPVFASPLAVYCGTYYGHLLAGALLLSAWLLVKNSKSMSGLAGFLSGLAVLTEYPVAVIVIGIGASVWKKRGMKSALGFCCGGLPALLTLLAYNWTLTGSPFRIVYSFVDDPQFAHMKTAYGFGLPSFHAATLLLFGLSRGSLVYAPALLALAWTARKNIRFLLHPLSLSLVAFFLCISSYKMYDGGWAFGPRHLIPALYLIFYEGILFYEANQKTRWPLYALSGLGIATVWMANATVTYMIPEDRAFPLVNVFLPAMAQGKFNAHNLASLQFEINPMLACILWLPIFAVALVAWNFWYLKTRSSAGRTLSGKLS